MPTSLHFPCPWCCYPYPKSQELTPWSYWCSETWCMCLLRECHRYSFNQLSIFQHRHFLLHLKEPVWYHKKRGCCDSVLFSAISPIVYPHRLSYLKRFWRPFTIYDKLPNCNGRCLQWKPFTRIRPNSPDKVSFVCLSYIARIRQRTAIILVYLCILSCRYMFWYVKVCYFWTKQYRILGETYVSKLWKYILQNFWKIVTQTWKIWCLLPNDTSRIHYD